MVVTTKFFKFLARNVALYIMSLAVISHITEAKAEVRGIGEIDLQLSSERTESPSSVAVERHLRLGLYGGLNVTRGSATESAVGSATESTPDSTSHPISHPDSGSASSSKDRISFGGFLKSDRGQQSLGALNSYGIGLFAGWTRKSLSLRVAYTLFGELKSMNSSVETSWRDVAGYELMARWITWRQELEGNREFALGPSLSYEKLSFKKSQVGSLPETNQDLIRETLVPGVSFVFVY
jgi:hypothetical protein